jgi:O-antigen ligase
MSRATGARDRLAVWCGWVMVGAAVLTPLIAWLAPLAFAVLLTLVGLLCLPALRVERGDRAALAALLVIVAWAVASSLWSPFKPGELEENTAAKLALELPLFWAAVCGARRADPRLGRWALNIMTLGMAAFGLVLVSEALTGGAVYRHLHEAYYEPIRLDLAQRNIGQTTFSLAVLWPLLALGAARSGISGWWAIAMVAGVAAAAWMFGFDAPVIALGLCPLAGLAAYAWPRIYPRLLAAKVAGFFLAAPLAMWALRKAVGLEALQADVPLSWAQRLGYWNAAFELIAAKSIRGWGLDASRTFAPAIELHPHNAPLQLWLELGAIGAAAAAVFWAAALARLSGDRRSWFTAAAVASASAYLLFGALNFGVWQEWWLALGALVAVVATLVARLPGAAARHGAVRMST